MRFIWDCPVSDQDHFNVEDFSKHVGSLADDSISSKVLKDKLASAVYLQVSTISQALIFVTRSRGWSFTERPGLLLVAAFIIAQLVRAHAINSSWLLNFGVYICIYINIYIYITLGRYICLQVATLLSAEVTSDLFGIRKIGWGWTAVIWLFNIVSYMLLDPIKFAVRYSLSGRAWGLLLNQRVCYWLKWLANVM